MIDLIRKIQDANELSETDGPELLEARHQHVELINMLWKELLEVSSISAHNAMKRVPDLARIDELETENNLLREQYACLSEQAKDVAGYNYKLGKDAVRADMRQVGVIGEVHKPFFLDCNTGYSREARMEKDPIMFEDLEMGTSLFVVGEE